MSAPSANPTAVPDGSLGPLSNGAFAIRSWQPSVLQVADRINDAIERKSPINKSLPLPEGMSLRDDSTNGQIQLVMDARTFAIRMRKVFGYIGMIELKEHSEGTTNCYPSLGLFFIRSFLDYCPVFPPLCGLAGIHFDTCVTTNCTSGAMEVWASCEGDGE